VTLAFFRPDAARRAREATVDVDFSHLVAVQIKDETNTAESPSPAADNTPRSGGLTSAAAGASASSTSPANEESVADLVNGEIEKGKNGDLDGAIGDFDGAIKPTQKMTPHILTVLKPNGKRRTRPAPLPITLEPSNSAPRTRLLTTIAVTPECRITTVMARSLTIHAPSNSNLITHAPTTIALSPRRPREMPRGCRRLQARERTGSGTRKRRVCCGFEERIRCRPSRARDRKRSARRLGWSFD